jgi:hypothetical protein
MECYTDSRNMELKVVNGTAIVLSLFKENCILLNSKFCFCFRIFTKIFAKNNVSEKIAAKLYEFDKNLRIFTKIEKGIFVSTLMRIKNTCLFT